MSLGSGAVTDSSQSGFQQYALADAVNCAKIPNNISDDEAVLCHPEECRTKIIN
jgi:NADPH:quinone reductase-like Zn-dependent oxidoreductase